MEEVKPHIGQQVMGTGPLTMSKQVGTGDPDSAQEGQV